MKNVVHLLTLTKLFIYLDGCSNNIHKGISPKSKYIGTAMKCDFVNGAVLIHP